MAFEEGGREAEGRASVDFYGDWNFDELDESNIEFGRPSSIHQRPSFVRGQSQLDDDTVGEDSMTGVKKVDDEDEIDDDDENISIQNLI